MLHVKLFTNGITHYIFLYNNYLQLLKRETAASPELHVVLDCGTSDDRTKISTSGSWSNGTGLLDSVLLPPLFPGGLVEPCAHIALPVLMEMGIRDYIILSGSHDGTASEKK